MRFFVLLGIALLGRAKQLGVVFHYSDTDTPEDKTLRALQAELQDILVVNEKRGAKAGVSFINPNGNVQQLKGKLESKTVKKFIRDNVLHALNLPSETKTGSGSGKQATIRRGHVVKLDGSNFHETVMKDTEHAYFIKFYAPWCGHCQAMEADWIKLAKVVDFDSVIVAEVNADAEKALASEFGVRGFPTLLYLPKTDKSRRIPFDGPNRTLDAFVKFVNRHNPGAAGKGAVVELTSNAVYEKECNSGDLCLITFLPHIYDTTPSERKRYIKVLKDVEKATSELPIRHLWVESGHNMELEEFFNLRFGWPASIIINQKKSMFAIHHGKTTVPDLTDFVKGVTIGKYKPQRMPQDHPPVWPDVPKWDGKDRKPTDEL